MAINSPSRGVKMFKWLSNWLPERNYSKEQFLKFISRLPRGFSVKEHLPKRNLCRWRERKLIYFEVYSLKFASNLSWHLQRVIWSVWWVVELFPILIKSFPVPTSLLLLLIPVAITVYFLRVNFPSRSRLVPI